MVHKAIAGVVVSLFSIGLGHCQSDLGVRTAENYRSEATLGLPEYLVIGKIIAKTDADSETPTESICPFRMYRDPDMELQGFWADRGSLVANDNGDLFVYQGDQTVSHPFVKFGHETIKAGKLVWSSIKPNVESPLSKTSYVVGPARGSPQLVGILQRPYDWPMAWIWCIRDVKPGEIPSAADYPLERMKCVEAIEEPRGSVTAKWVKTRKEPKHNLEIDEVREIEYKDDLVVKCRSYYVALSGDRKKVQNRYREDFVKTKWGEKNGEKFPVHVEWVSEVKSEDTRFLTYEIRFQWFFPGDKEFDDFRSSLLQRIDELKKLPAPGVPPSTKK